MTVIFIFLIGKIFSIYWLREKIFLEGFGFFGNFEND